MRKLTFRFSSIAVLAGLGLASSLSPLPVFADDDMPPEMRREAMAVIKACRQDYKQLCGELEPGGGRILNCLQEHTAQLSTPCYAAMPKAQALINQAMQAGMVPQ